MSESKVLLANADVAGIESLAVYERHGGYQALKKGITQMTAAEVAQAVLDSGLRGRGGAGFPTGRKWSFLPNDGRPRILVCNADEGEPGTFKDHYLIHRLPHLLVEGMILSAYAIGAPRAFIYLRGEFLQGYELLEQAMAEATAAGYLGAHILGTDYALDLQLYRGAGAYICGEETALLDSLEGRRGIPRMKPPFPATAGLYGLPTVVNNVETLCAVVPIVEHGGAWFKSMGTEKSPGTKIYSMSGSLQRPGNYEFEMGVKLSDLIEAAGGLLPGRSFKAVVPGGASAAYLTGEHIDIAMDYDTLAQSGTMLGSGGVIVLDDSVCIVSFTRRAMEFFRHESCGKCTPCREGTLWMDQVLSRLELGQGTEADLNLLLDLSDNIAGRTFCAFGDAAVAMVASSVRLFRQEYVDHFTHQGCPLLRERVG
ncbi:MAG: NADH-quinone oxidoreductase subunit NuoF [Sulfobacillus sp.]